MSKPSTNSIIRYAIIVTAIVFAYWAVVGKLALDWWSDENYSHGLLVPFVIGLIIWFERPTLERAPRKPLTLLGLAITVFGVLLLIGGTLAAELFVQRISLPVLVAGLIVYFAGTRIVSLLAVPFGLLVLAIPIPQIVFNQIALPLQIIASRMAVWAIRLAEVPTTRNGNVIDILPRGSTQTISLEVVEACSGIRSLMTLVTLALVLAYFTRRVVPAAQTLVGGMTGADVVRTLLLMLASVPIAVVTNAGRVATTGILTYMYGKGPSEGLWHEASGWLVYVVALAMLFGLNVLLKRVLSARPAK